MDTKGSHMTPDPKYTARIKMGTLNRVIYSRLTPPLGSFWVQSLRSEQKFRNPVTDPIWSGAVTCPLFGHWGEARMVPTQSRGGGAGADISRKG